MGIAFISAALFAHTLSTVTDKPTYPATRRSDYSEEHFGIKVDDPYRWLEDANSEETKAWVKAENAVTFDYLHAIPQRQHIIDRLTKLWNYERYTTPTKAGKHYVFEKNDGLQNQSVMYVSDSLNGKSRVLLNPNTLSKDGTVALSGTSLSEDGKYLAYSISKGGSDWQEWFVRDVDTGKDLGDHIEWSKFSGAAWSHDEKGFYYSAYDAPNEKEALQEANYFQKVYYHLLGTPQSADRLVYERKDHKDWGFGGFETEDGRYLVIQVSKGTNRESMIFVRDLQVPNAPVVEVLNKFDAAYRYLANNGATFYFKTDNAAPNSRVISLDLNHPEPEHWHTVVPERKEALESAGVVGDSLFVSYLKDAVSRVYEYDLSGHQTREVALPGLGTVTGFDGLRKDKETFYSYVGYLNPAEIFRFTVKNGKSSLYKKPTLDFDASQFESKEVFYASKDGTQIPLFLTHKKGMKLDGSNPTLLYGYGGFDISSTPFFSVRMVTWMEMGGVVAVACIRGGGEYGKAWHDGGRLFNKQNCFDDFIGAGEYLIKSGITSTPKLALQGGSNGGLLVGACITQRPDLWGAALPQVGVMDMLRFHKFTIGWAWKSDYGDPDKEVDFKYLLTYSPLQNIKSGTAYPPTLVMTGDHDDRVVPAHSFKFGAELQFAQAGDKPILIRIETSAGHGAGKPTSKSIEEAADGLAFLVKSLGVGP